MAEVGILIIFVLLLLIAFEELRRERVVREFHGKVALTPERLHQLEANEKTLLGVAGELGIDLQVPDDLARRLVRIMQILASPSPGQSALAEAKDEVEKLRRTAKALEKALRDVKANGAGALVKQLEEQGFKIGNQEGQLRHYEKKLAEVGQGKGERPCWVKPDGSVEYLYEVVLTSAGIRMREYPLPHRLTERGKLPMPSTDFRETLSQSEFVNRTRALYDSSFAENCRFFVVVYDATASHEKLMYKDLLRTVEGHFYKRLDSGPAPF
jgi:hypothetical protein